MFYNKNIFIPLSIFTIYFFVGLFIYKDYGIGIEEHFQRQNGFYWLSYLLTFTNFENLKEIVNIKYQSILYNNPDLPKPDFFNFYGILFDVPAAFIESIFNIQSSKIYFEIRHILNFIIFFIGAIFFYKILYKRFKFTVSIIGLLIYISMPRIFGDSFHNNKDVFFLSIFSIALFYCFELLNKESFKNIIIFCLFSALATSSRIIGIFFPFSVIFFLFWEFLSGKKNLKTFLTNSFTILFLFFLFLFLHFPYTWSLELKNIFSWLDPFFYNMGMDILFNGKYYNMKYLPMLYLPTWIAITTPIYYLIFFSIGFYFLILKLFKRIIEIEERSTGNDLWRDINEKKDAYIIICFLIFISYACFFNVAMISGWRFFYFLHIFIVYIAVYGLNLIYLYCLKKNINKNLFALLIIIPILFIFYKIIIFHPYQSLYFNLFINSSNVSKFQVDTPSLSRSDALKNILIHNKNKKKIINVANASWTPFYNGKDKLKIDEQNKFNFVGQEYENADYIYTNFIYEIDTKFDDKYKIPKDFYEIKKIIINEIPIYSIYKRRN